MSRIRTALAAIGIAAVAATSLTLAAPAATAASNPGTIFYSVWPGCWSSTSVRMNPGDSLTITRVGTVNLDLDVDGAPYQNNVSSTSVSFTTLGTHTISSTYSPCGTVTVEVVAEPVAAPPAHDYFQQVGVPASGNCADVDPHIGHWPGFPLGGWSKSWAWWINGGNGGPVCTREVEERPDGTIVLIG